jgi:hypothetical protein
MTQDLAKPVLAMEAARSLGLDQAAWDARVAQLGRARGLYPNQGLHGAAEAFAWAHERAVQYLEAAPVLALAIPRASTARDRTVAAWVRHVAGPLCERGAPLKDVMRAFKLAPPLRKLKGYGLVPSYSDLVLGLSKLPPEVLGQTVPEGPGAQKRWLAACEAWRAKMRRHKRFGDHGFAWAAVAMARAGVKRTEVDDVADFYVSGEPFNAAWVWKRAAEEAHLWAARLTMERALKGTGVEPDTRIDFGVYAARTKVGDLTVHALRTPLALYQEGAAMRHCVATYIGQVVSGRSHIFGIRQGERRIATLELDEKLAVRQLKGPCNAAVPATRARGMSGRALGWAKEAGAGGAVARGAGGARGSWPTMPTSCTSPGRRSIGWRPRCSAPAGRCSAC